MAATVKLSDIAQRLGLSLTTVSRALNGYDDVSNETKETVRRMAEEMGYVVNRRARALALRKNHLVSIMINDDDRSVRPYQSITFELIAGIRDFFGTTAYDILILPQRSNEIERESLASVCGSRGLDGVLVIGIRTDDPYVEELKRDEIPAVTFDFPLSGRRTTWVESDNLKGCSLAVDLLVSRGHRRIAFFNGHEHAAISATRLDGFRRALEQNGMALDTELVFSSDFTERGGYETAGRLLESKKSFSALFAASDLMALGAIKRFLDAGLSVPEDIAVVGFDDIFFAEYSHPRLTTIRQHLFDLGRVAAKELFQIMENPEYQTAKRTVDVDLVIRESV